MSNKSHSETSSMGSKPKKNVPSKMSDDGLDDEVDDKGVIKRKSRNLSEKKRRDQFNVLINELCSMVCTGKRKMDKSTVLKSAISFIRNHNQVAMQSQSQEVQEDWKPSFLSNEEFTHLMLEALDGFIMVFTSTGKILYVSENITCLLGHVPNDLIGTMIYDLVWEEEQSEVQSFLGSWAASDSQSESRGKENHLSLRCHLRRGSSCGDFGANYELVCFSGYYRLQGTPEVSSGSRVSSSWGEDSKGSSSFGDALSQYNGLVFVASARLQTPQLIVEMSLVDVSKSEFTSRHSLEWKFLFLDHRGPPIIGYLPFEVLGTSGYDYYHIDDLEKVSACHEALMQKGEGTSCCYRFLTKGQQWIWLQTKYYITYHQWNSKPEFIVCSHRVVSHSEVIGHPVKESGASKNESRNSNATEVSIPGSSGNSNLTNKSKSDHRSNSSSNNNMSKSPVYITNVPSTMQSTSSSNRSGMNANANRERSKHSSKYSHPHHHRVQQQPSSGTMSENSGDSGVLLPPPAPPGGNETMIQHSRHPSGSSRGMGATLSDTGSISSSGSFQSAASQHSGHSRQSDQSMQSLHSQQSHHSMQSAHSQHSSQHSSVRPSSSGQSCNTQHHQNKLITSTHQQSSQSHYAASSNQYRNTHASNSRSGEVETYLTSSGSSPVASAGHRFLQPRTNSATAVRRGSVNSSAAVVTSAVPTSGTSSGTFTYQPVLPIGVADGSHAQGVTLPVQRIIEGLPVVTLPAGLVAHEPIVMTAAQRQLHEQLRVKHAQLQRQIMAQQEELRRVSEQLLLAQYGAWGSTVLKMTVPFSEAESNSATTTSATHAVLSAGGLVTCLTTDSPVSLAQTSSSPQLNSAPTGQTVTLSPGTPILVQSPEIHAQSSPGASELSVSADPAQVVFRTALQQDTLVQLSQQDVQMLLAQSLLQDNPSLSIEYLP